MIETKEFTIASKDEALWVRAKESAESRIKQMKEALTIDEAFIELCNKKIEEHKNDLSKSEVIEP